MYEKLGETEDAVNERRVYLIKEVLTKMKKMIKNIPEDTAPKIRTNEQIMGIVERILRLITKLNRDKD